MKRRFNRFLVASLSLFHLSVFATVEEGANWLSDKQHIDGGVYSAGDRATEEQSTSEAIALFSEKIALSVDISTATAFLQSKLSETAPLQTEFIARGLLAGLVEDAQGNDLIEQLLEARNDDGGFGDKAGYDSTAYDTAFALAALARKDDTSYKAGTAVGYLLSTQSFDGGWQLNGNADTTVTALTTRVLWHFRHRFSAVPAALQQSMQYLLSQQLNSLWASDAQTAQALLAILPISVDPALTENSINALAAQQQSSGAWSEDVYSTALALRALLLAAKPKSNPDLVHLTGKVIDGETYLPLVGVNVALGGASSLTVLTDAQGIFNFEGLTPGSYSLSIAPADYAGITWQGEVSAGESRDLGDIAFIRLTTSENPATAFLQGRATDATTGEPLPGVLISVGGTTLSVLTDEAGNYLITGIDAGQVAVSAQKQGYTTLSGVGVVSAGQVLLFSPRLHPIEMTDSQIAGVITDADTGAPLAGIAVSLSGANNTMGTTDITGYYLFSGLVPGPTTLLVSSALYQDVSATVDIVAGGQYDASIPLTPLGDEVVVRPASLKGMVVNGIEGPGLEGVTVELTLNGKSYIQQTNNEGVLDFQDLPAGEATLRFSAEGYFDRQITLTLENGIAVDIGKVVLASTAIGYGFGGVVVDSSTNLPLADVMVTAETLGRTTVLMTDSYGQFYLEGIGDAQITLRFEKEDYVGAELVPFLEAGVVTDLGQIRLRYAGYTSLLADLVVTEVDTQSVYTDPATLNVSGQLAVRVKNQGFTDVSADFDIAAFYDVNADGKLDDDDVHLGQTRFIEVLDDEQSVSIEVEGILPYRDAPITVFVDVLSEVLEADRENNVARHGCIKDCVLLADDFNDGNAQGWTEIPNQVDSTTAWTVIDGAYDAGGVGAIAFIGDVTWRNYIAETKIRFPDGADNDAGLLFRYQGQDNWYQFSVRNGAARIISRINGNVNANVQFSSAITITPNQWYTLKVELRGARVIAYLDDSLVFDYTGVQLNQGAVGYLDEGVHVQYDDLKVSNCSSEFLAQEEWHWNGAPGVNASVFGPELVAQITDDNGDGLINSNDMPDIIFHSDSNDLVAISGLTGQTHWATSEISVAKYGSPSLADIDHDGIVEIISISHDRQQIHAFEHTGQLKWSAPTGPPKSNPGDAVSIADLDHDGNPEIIHGRRVYSSEGVLSWEGTGHHGGEEKYGIISIAADVDLSGDMEVIAGATAYNSDGSIKWHQSSAGPGLNAVGNFDEDDFAEVVLISFGRLYVLEHTGEIKWGPVSIGGGAGGTPTIADVDGDGEPEIGIAGSRYFSVFETDGSVKWRYPVSDFSSARTGSSVFDFQGDGRAELVYADEYFLRVFDGETGEVLLQESNRSGTTLEYPVIADIDNDGSAEIIFGSNFGAPNTQGVRAFGSLNNDWVGTRAIWNQHSYHINNINDDGTVPVHEKPSWLDHNTYRLNRFPGAGSQDIHDLTLGLLTVVDNGAGSPLSLTARIGNAGALQSPATTVAFYRNSLAGELLGEIPLDALQADTYTKVKLDGVYGLSRNDTVIAVVNYAGRFAECDSINNTQSITVDAILGKVTVATDAMAYLLGTDVFVTATVENTGIFASDYDLVWRVEDASGNQVAELLGTSLTGLSSGVEDTYSLTWNTDQIIAGGYRVKATLFSRAGAALSTDVADFIISETDVKGNLATVGTAIASDQQVYQTWDNVQLIGHVKNNAVNVALPDAKAVLQVTSPSGAEVLQESFSVPSLSAQAVQSLQSLLNLNEAEAGLYQVRLNLLSDIDGALLSASVAMFSVVHQPVQALLGTTTAYPTRVERGSTVSCADEITNRSIVSSVTVTVDHLLLDPESQQQINSASELLTLQPGQSNTYVYGNDTASLPEGGYICVQLVTMGGETTTLSHDSFSVVVPPIIINSEIGERGRLLILLDGPDGSAPNDLSDLQAQHDYLRALLDAGGYSYTIVFTGEDFDREMATGFYHSYALMSEQVTLLPDTEQILVEAVNAGAGLLISGAFNRRNNHIESALGIYVTGNETQADGVLIPTGNLGSEWEETIVNPGRKLDFQLCGAQILAAYMNAKKTNQQKDICYNLAGIDPAAAEHHYGKGRGVYVGFDSLDEAVFIGGDNAYTQLLRYGFASIQPTEFPEQKDLVVPLVLSVTGDTATDLALQIDLPANLLLVDALPVLTLADEVLNLWTWQGVLSADEPLIISLYLKQLDDMTATVDIELEALQNATTTSIGHYSHTFEPSPKGNPLTEAITYLQALALQGASNNVDLALNNAISAQHALAAGEIATAINDLLKALDKLANESSAPTQQARLLLDSQLFILLAMHP